jgi:hypothetical protein
VSCRTCGNILTYSTDWLLHYKVSCHPCCNTHWLCTLLYLMQTLAATLTDPFLSHCEVFALLVANPIPATLTGIFLSSLLQIFPAPLTGSFTSPVTVSCHTCGKILKCYTDRLFPPPLPSFMPSLLQALPATLTGSFLSPWAVYCQTCGKMPTCYTAWLLPPPLRSFMPSLLQTLPATLTGSFLRPSPVSCHPCYKPYLLH